MLTRAEMGRVKASLVPGRREKTPPRLFRCNPCSLGQGCCQTNGPNSRKVCNGSVISKRLSRITVIMSKNREGQTGWPHRSTPGNLLPRKGCVSRGAGRRGKWEEGVGAGAEPPRPGSQGAARAEPPRQLGCPSLVSARLLLVLGPRLGATLFP